MSDAVEWLAVRWYDECGFTSASKIAASSDALWWMNEHVKLFEEREAHLREIGRDHEADAYGIVLDWLRTQATQEGEDV